jgi:hypothetical protein
MPIDQYPNRQAWINNKTRKAVYTYPKLWQELVVDWQSSDGEDALWLTYAAN